MRDRPAAQTGRRRRVRRLSQNLALLGVACAIGLLLIEALLRVYAALVPTPPDSIFLPDPDTSYRLRPDSAAVYHRTPDHYINQLGFRDRPRSVQKPVGGYRVLGIGDSFVYGSTAELEDHFLRVAERRLLESGVTRELGKDSLEVLLMGVGGYSPEHEVGVLRSVGLDLSPDIVVLNFFVGNDVTGIPVRTRVIAGRTYVIGSPYPWLEALRKSMLFVLAENVVLPRFRAKVLELYMKIGRGGRGVRNEVVDDGRDRSVESRAVGDGPRARRPSEWFIHAQLKDLPVYRLRPDSRTEALWAESEGYLREFDQLCREAGVPWAIHLIPSDIQVDSARRLLVLESLGLAPGAYDFDGPQRRLAGLADEMDVPCHDPLQAMRAVHDPADPLYRFDDIHWTVRGNQVAGELLGDFLSETIRNEGAR